MPEKKSAGESFAGNVMKYSVATYLGFAITGLALIVKGLLPAEVLGAPVTFMTYTATVMNLGILGLDQTLLRFYHEPPAGAEPRQLFAAVRDDLVCVHVRLRAGAGLPDDEREVTGHV